MFEWILILGLPVAVALGVLGGYWFSRGKLKQAFEMLKQATERVRADSQRIEGFLVEAGQKDVLIERSALLLEARNQKMREMMAGLAQIQQERETLKSTLEFQNAQYEKLLGQKKSSEVRVGKITEQLAPFLADFRYDSTKARFLGDPIDFVVFGEDAVVFVEVKSGKSQLNSNQRRIRDLIKAGKVEFDIYRVEGDGDGSNPSDA